MSPGFMSDNRWATVRGQPGERYAQSNIVVREAYGGENNGIGQYFLRGTYGATYISYKTGS